MHDAHKGLHLTDHDFNALVEDLQKGMDEAGVPFPIAEPPACAPCADAP